MNTHSSSLHPLCPNQSTVNREPTRPTVPPTELTRDQRRRLRRRQRLIDAARQVIAEKGVANFTVADVTEAADMAVGSFYTYFPDKQALLEATIWEELEELGRPLLAADMSLPPFERARRTLLQTYRFVEDHRELMQAVFGAGFTAEAYQRGMEIIEARVREGLEREPLIPRERVPLLASLIAGMVAGGIRYALDHPEITPEEMTEHTVAFLRGLTPG